MKIIIEGREINTNKALIIAEDNGGTVASLADGMSYADAIQMVGTLSLHIMNVFAKLYPDAKEDMYTDFNMTASAVLATFIPDKELRPDLTADAIVRMENTLVEEKYSKLNREQRRSGAKHVESVRRKYAKKV